MSSLIMQATAAAADYEFLRQIVRGVSQNVVDQHRDHLFDMRLESVMRDAGVRSLPELVDSLRQARNPKLEHSIAEAMTVNETSFFRDARPFRLLRTELLPRIIQARQRERELRIWSAGCSTGQEAYSLAILVREHFPQLKDWKVSIEGTDISRAAVERATAGRYHRMEVNRGIPAHYLTRCFEPSGEDWVVTPEIRALCSFRTANLCASSSGPGCCFDVILLRNVMLYFGREARQRLLADVHRQLRPDGVLFLGSSEQPVDITRWRSVLTEGTCYYRPIPLEVGSTRSEISR